MAESKSRAMIFIDGPNLLSSAKQIGLDQMDFREFVKILSEGASNVGANFYGTDKPTLTSFYQALETRFGIHVHRVSENKSVDGRLIFDALVAAYHGDYDIGVIVSGDGDFTRLVEELKRRGRTVWVAAFDHAVNPGLQDAAHRYVSLNKLVERLRLRSTAQIPG